MDMSVYEWENRQEEKHWWFKARRVLLSQEIKKLMGENKNSVLDIGTSTGTNLRMLKSLGFNNITGVDSNSDAIRYCKEKEFYNMIEGTILNLPFEKDSFQLVLATDILEHVKDDSKAVKEIVRVLKPGGIALITVPTFPSLWGIQDVAGQHYRRYKRKELMNLLRTNGLLVDENDCYYFNFFLFVPIWIARKGIRILQENLGLLKNIKHEGQINTNFLNALLYKIFYIDISIARQLRVPFGVSCFALCRHP